jgi:putative nucleotidyltransferase with HDIG domain
MTSCTIGRMSVPDRVEAARLLLSRNPPPWHLRHSRAVAETAGWLAARIAAAGIPIQRRLVESAALLHDIDKLLPPDDPARGLPHGDAGADWLTRQGHPELARAVANHPVTRLGDEDRYRRWSAFASREERIVAYADKRCGQRLEPMAQRFAEWERRFPPIDRPRAQVAMPTGARVAIAREGVERLRDATARHHAHEGASWDRATQLRVRQRAGRLEADICRAANVQPEEIGRLAWTARAIAMARA